MSKHEWTQEWPDEVGMYWFYSYRYGRESCGRKCEPRLMLMKASKTKTGLVCVADGQLVYKSEPEEAWFMKVDEPELPRGFKL